MEQVERICHMETILDQAERVLAQMRLALEQYQELESPLNELEDYYSNGQWRKDFQDDSEGKLPEHLKRGVLSEDGVWNMLTERDSLLWQMEKILERTKNDS